MAVDSLRGCESPITVEIPMTRSRRVGLYELAVGRHRRVWYWAVFLNDEELRSGECSTERAAMNAADRALQKLSQA